MEESCAHPLLRGKIISAAQEGQQLNLGGAGLLLQSSSHSGPRFVTNEKMKGWLMGFCVGILASFGSNLSENPGMMKG